MENEEIASDAFALAAADMEMDFLSAYSARPLHSTATGQAHSLLHNFQTEGTSNFPFSLTSGSALLNTRVR